jgi:type II secretory pathway pseudopilin PulG
MKVHFRRQKLAAVSLVEVMVVLAIVAATMVGGMRLTVIAFTQIKKNEITDYATGVMIKALEIAKSPSLVRATSGFGTITDFDGSYVVQMTGDEAVINQLTTTVQALTTCDRSSPYYIDIQVSSGQVPIACLQLNVTEKEGLTNDYYEIEARVVYVIDNTTTIKTITGYRVNDFQTV